MILQRNTNLKLWGWASPMESLKLKLGKHDFKTKADKEGKWSITFPPINAGGPYTLTIDASNHLAIHDIYFGDVWLCSGQSNMVHQMELHKERYAREIEQADDPMIRQFWIPTLLDLHKPQNDFPSGSWKCATPQNVLQFSAVAYFFAKSIYQKYHIPIGLINASVGGTPIEAWTSQEGLREFPSIINTIEKNKDTAYINDLVQKGNAVDPMKMATSLDKGLIGPTYWYDTSYQPKGWRNINIPGYWEDQGVRNLDGVVWYRREIDVPASMTDGPAKIAMGRIVDADEVYVNGKLVGRTYYQYPQRRYQIPSGILKAGKNIIVVRVTNLAGKGGFVPDKPYYITANGQTIDLKEDWQYKVGAALPPLKNNGGITLIYQPAALFNAMIAPLTQYSIKGILWYQGEANTWNAAEYQKLLPALIADWRHQWNKQDLPFIYVQLPNFLDVDYLPAESQWAALREAQLKTLSVPNTGMAVTIDLGEWNDIHPDRKKEVGERLALVAENIVYGDKQVVPSGPICTSSRIDDNKIILNFNNTGSGLITNDGEELSDFAIAGADKKFVWAKAKIEGNTVVVWNDQITHPLYVRYAWADNPDHPNLYNKEGLPASPFRTDQ